VRAADQYHVGIVVDDLDASVAELADLFGYEWGQEFSGPAHVSLPSGDTVVDLRFVYSASTPRLEMIQCIPGTLWMPAAGSGVHHIGYWSDDVPADSAALESRGYTTEAVGTRPDGTAYWAYHRKAGAPRIEVVSREIEPSLSQLWSVQPTDA
jgi:hypothetical protein